MAKLITATFWLLLYPVVTFLVVVGALLIGGDYQGLSDAIHRFLRLYGIAFAAECLRYFSWLFIFIAMAALFAWVLYIVKRGKLLLVVFNIVACMSVAIPPFAIILWLGPGYCGE